MVHPWLVDAVICVHLSTRLPDDSLQGIKKYEVIKEIGNGSFAKVFLVTCKLTMRVFAMK
jgi:hypothetical protein